MPTLLEISNQVGQEYKKRNTLLGSSATQKPQSNIQKTFSVPSINNQRPKQNTISSGGVWRLLHCQ